MSMTPNKKAKWITGVIIGAIVLIAVAVSVCLATLSNSNAPKIAILSCPEKVYYIDSDYQSQSSFIIKSAYVYDDGGVEDTTGTVSYNFVNDKDSDLLSIDSTGKIEVKFDAFSAADSSYQVDKDDIIKVEIIVSSTLNDVDDIRHTINVVRKNDYNITLDLNGGSLTDVNPETTVPAWEGQAVSLSNPTLANYAFDGWYVIQNGKDKTYNYDEIKFFSDDIYYWGDDIILRARYKANVKLDMDGIDAETSTKEIKDVYFNEELSSKQIQVLNQDIGILESDGWHLRGWFTEKAGTGFENGLKNGVFCAVEPILYAKWCGTATLTLTEIIHNDDNKDIVTRDGKVGVLSPNAITEVPVVYNGTLKLESSQIPTYPEGGTFGGWYTAPYGAGEQISNEFGVGIYNSKSLQLYDKIVFTVNIDYNSATGNYDETHNEFVATYGTVVDFVGNGLGRNPTKTGWDFDGWQVVYGNYSFDVAENMQYTLLGDIKIEAQWKWVFELNTAIDDYLLEQNSVTLIYGEELSIQPINDWGSWTFEGWYTQNAGDGKLIEKTSDYENTSDRVLYAKWVLHKLTLNTVTPQVKEYQVFNDANIVYGKTIASSLGKTLPIPESPKGYSNGLGWFNGLDDSAEQITNAKTDYPKTMDVLYYKWTPKTYTVTFDHNGGLYGYTGSITATMGQMLPDLTEYVPAKYSYTFLGYYYSTEDNLYYSADMTGCKEWDISDSDNIRLTALWGNPCEVTLDSVIPLNFDYDDKEGSGSIKVRLGDSMPSGYIAPQRAGYTFAGFYEKKDGQGRQYYDASMKSVNVWEQDVDSATIYACWIANTITASPTSASLTLKNSGTTDTLTISGLNGSGKYGFAVVSTGHSNLSTVNVDSSGLLTLTTSSNKDDSGTVVVMVTDLRTQQTANCSIKYTTKKEGCFATGTLISMGDGTQKKIEDIKVGDIVMSWNFVTGQLEAMPVALYWYHGTSVYTVINLEFSDGKILRIIAEHGLFDCDLNKYIFISEDNYAEFIGHSFVIYDGAEGYTKTLLVNVYLTSEEVGSYSLRTACNDNAFAEGLLSLTAEDYPGYLTYFEVGENLKYDEIKMQADIKKYGLFTYEDWYNDWSKYVSYEEFIAFNGQYFKVLIGKGILTYEDILTLIDGLRNGSDIQS